MKLKKEDIIRYADTSPLKLLEQGLKTEATRSWYMRTLRREMCEIFEEVLEGDFEERTKQFVQHAKDDPDWVTDLMLNLSFELRKRTELPKNDDDYLNPSSVKGYFKPIKKLLDMSGASISWKRVYATFPEKDNMLDNKGWTSEEISAILSHARDPMDRALILVLASSGVRLGGLDLKWGDLTAIYLSDGRLTADPDPGADNELACAALNVYAGYPQNYTAFITREAYEALQKYGRMWADLMKSPPRDEDPVFLSTKLLPRKANEPAIAKRIRRMAMAAGLRNVKTKKGKRFRVQLVHGFRKFFYKTCSEVLSGDSLAALVRAEYMMGHQGLVALNKNYFKTDMLEMAATYVKAAPALTIGESERMKSTNRRMYATIQKLESEKNSTVAGLEKQVAELQQKNSEVTDMLERVKTERGISGEKVESVVEMIHQMKKDHEAEMKEMRDKYENRPVNTNNVIDAILRSPRADEILDVIQERASASGKESGSNIRRRRDKQPGDEAR